jgi:hypothetical protein
VDVTRRFAWQYALDPVKEVMLEWDFDEGELPEHWTHGDPVERGRGHCLQGVKTPFASMKKSVVVKWPKGQRQAYSDGLVVEFDYFLKGQDATLLLRFYNWAQREDYDVVIEKPVLRRWARATVRLSEARPKLEELLGRAGRTVEGETVSSILIGGGGRGEEEVLVDNVSIIRYRPDRVPGTSAR